MIRLGIHCLQGDERLNVTDRLQPGRKGIDSQYVQSVCDLQTFEHIISNVNDRLRSTTQFQDRIIRNQVLRNETQRANQIAV